MYQGARQLTYCAATAVTAVLMPAMVAFPALTLVAVCVVAWARRRDTAALLRGLRR